MTSTNTICDFIQFGLIVTGVGEEKYLPKLFKSLMASGICNFRVLRRIGQRSPITSPKRRLKMVGSGKRIASKDEVDIGLTARKYLFEAPCHFVILVDDLEYARRTQVQPIFKRYREALDTMLTAKQQRRASVHFLVYMLEAYYFAHTNAVNTVLELNHPLKDYEGDVETIRHPKNELKKLFHGFDEVEDGGKILDHLDVAHILDEPNACASLRTLFAWCVKVLAQYANQEYYQALALETKYHLDDGILSEITKGQLDTIALT